MSVEELGGGQGPYPSIGPCTNNHHHKIIGQTAFQGGMHSPTLPECPLARPEAFGIAPTQIHSGTIIGAGHWRQDAYRVKIRDETH